MSSGPSQQVPQTSVLVLARQSRVVKSALLVALVVGSILNLINQGDALLGDTSIVWWKLGLTYIVPYCVSTYGAVMALRSQDEELS